MDGIKTKRLIETAEMEYAELMYEMYAEPETSYGDITRYFTENEIQVYGKTLKQGFVAQLLRNPVYVQADMDIYEHFKAQGAKIESPPELFTGDYSCYLYQGLYGEENILVIAPHKGRIPSALWLNVQHKLSQNTTFQNGRKCHNTWLAGANPLLLQYANSRIEELDAERQKQLKLVADLTANSVSSSQIDSISGYLQNWDEVSFDDKRRVVDTLIFKIEATSTQLTIHWKI